ncbi:helix-turn-helix domain-containing protein [Micromonospora peucetia]|uniref:Helix-turn-helix domain-containing protein n=1 Tax=Micromonospora peucetia TaxID=47871 RepID=A0A1C6W3N3_9ACTN|nr:helix-turn-helix transcriptional regulator [Micromonospora peucetia]MCX4390385.1 helix-turn-helix domain-containing protein [Micromonospora peucetia]SCL73173.1 Helix-turn-helix domain-containing protein [Micromonospora peucetia]
MVIKKTDTVGARIRYWRMRRGGMTQAVLAGLAGVSQSYVSQIESGRKTIDRRSTLVALAAALQVTVADLLGQGTEPGSPARDGAAEWVPAIWSALIEIEDGERRSPTRTRKQLAADIARCDQLRTACHHPTMARMLPGLLLDAAAVGGVLLTQVAYQASTCLRNLGYRHLALNAARVAVSAAYDVQNPAWIGASRFAYAQSLPIESARLAARAADRALTELQARAADVRVRQMLGQLHLSAALTSTVSGRPDDARDHLTEATREAASLGDPPDGAGFNGCGFGPTNVGLWEMTIAAEQGESGRVIELSRKVRPQVLTASIRQQSYWLDLGRALADGGRRDAEALAAFVQAEQAAPVPFVLNPLARDAVVALAQRAKRRAVPDDLRSLAGRMGISLAV